MDAGPAAVSGRSSTCSGPHSHAPRHRGSVRARVRGRAPPKHPWGLGVSRLPLTALQFDDSDEAPKGVERFRALVTAASAKRVEGANSPLVRKIRGTRRPQGGAGVHQAHSHVPRIPRVAGVMRLVRSAVGRPAGLPAAGRRPAGPPDGRPSGRGRERGPFHPVSPESHTGTRHRPATTGTRAGPRWSCTLAAGTEPTTSGGSDDCFWELVGVTEPRTTCPRMSNPQQSEPRRSRRPPVEPRPVTARLRPRQAGSARTAARGDRPRRRSATLTAVLDDQEAKRQDALGR